MKILKLLSFTLNSVHPARKLNYFFISKSFILLFVMPSSLSWSNPNFNEKLDREFKDTLPTIISEIIERSLSLPSFNNEMPFWHQIGNPEQVFIEDFYANSNSIVMDQIKEGQFYQKLHSMRDIKFLKSYFTKKFSKNKANAVSRFTHNLEFLKLLSEHIENKDLNSIKSFMEEHRFSKTEKILTIVILIHKQRFNDQIFNFIKDLSLDINQTIKNNHFIYSHFPFLKPNIAITSLAHELIATGNSSLIQKVLEDKIFDPNIKTPLGENLIHFLIRSNLKSQTQSIHLILNQFSHLIKEKDLMGLTPLMLAAQWNNRIFIDETLSFILNKNSDLSLKDILTERDPYGRDLIDIAVYNNHLELASHLMKTADRFSIDMKSNLYAIKPESNQLVITNKLPYIQISPIFFSYIENLQNIFKQISFEEEPPIDEKELQKLNSLKKDVIKIDSWEQQRQIVISQLLKEKNFFSVISAIQKRSKKALIELDEQEKQILNLLISLKENTSESKERKPQENDPILIPENIKNSTYQENKPIILTHFLNEAIIYSSLPAVEFLLENHFNKKWFKLSVEYDATNTSFIIDPLSLALFTYASIPHENKKLKKEARQIIRTLSKYQNPENYPNSKIYSSPMGWAISLGLLDEVKFFHEERDAEIPEQFIIGLDDKAIQIDTLISTEIHDFLLLRKYILENQFSEGLVSKCEQVFIN